MFSYFSENLIEGGVDEAGRGCLAGPICSAVVILPKNYKSNLIKDSKKMSDKKRREALEEIKENALDWGYAFVTPKEIDLINIQKATYLSMHKAIDSLKIKPELLLVDGNCFEPYNNINHKTIIKGDDKYYSIAAASIVAKVMRDDYMIDLHERYPVYDWLNNKGYGSKKHIQSINKHGITEEHRVSFLKNITY
jgi:ribonuclease HII